MILFSKRKLRDAIKANDVVAVSAIVHQSGRQILDRGLPVRLDLSGFERKMYLSFVADAPPALVYALSLKGDNKDMVTALVNLGARMRTPGDEYGDYPLRHGYDNVLFYAAALGRADVLAGWIEKYPDLAREDGEGDTLLHVACRHYQEDCVRFLLENGRYTDERNDAGQSPLNLSAGHMGIVNMVLTVGTEIAQRRYNRGLATPAPAVAEPEQTWRLLPNGDVCRSEHNVVLTDVFNFKTLERKRHYRCDDTGVERTETCAFSQLEPAAHADAVAAWRVLVKNGATQMTRDDLARALDPLRPQVLVKRKS